MLNNQKTWVLVNLGSNGGSGGIDPDVTVVYEGGEMA
jgi:hypothetical protein